MPITPSRATLIAGVALLVTVAVVVPTVRELVSTSMLAIILIAGSWSVPQAALAQAREARASAERTRRKIAHLI